MPSKHQLQVTVLFTKEEDTFIAYCPPLDLSTCGKTFEEAQKNFEEAAVIFMKECTTDGTLTEVLESLGWKKTRRPPKWQPPTVVGRVDMPISVPA